MATDLERPGGTAPAVGPDRIRSGLLRNLALARALAAGRRRDVRFRVLPFDGFGIVNALAVVASMLAVLVFVLDPLVSAWRATLSEPLLHFFGQVTRFGKSDWSLIASGIVVIAIALLDASRLRPRLRARRAIRTLAALYVFASVAIAGLIANVSKDIIGRARPSHFAETGSVAFHPFTLDASWASFPSGHATNALALTVSLGFVFPRLRALFLCLGLWIAASRLFVGAHYPSDVLAGGLLGALTAWLIARAFARRRLVFGFDADGRIVRRMGASGRLV